MHYTPIQYTQLQRQCNECGQPGSGGCDEEWRAGDERGAPAPMGRRAPAAAGNENRRARRQAHASLSELLADSLTELYQCGALRARGRSKVVDK